jgi:hypothetical protein
MGVYNDLSESKLSFSKIQEILNNLITQGGAKSQNRQVLQEIGFLNEYAYVISGKTSNEMIYYSKNHKIIKKFLYSSQIRTNFLAWTKYLFNISDEELNSMQKFNMKIENFKKRTLTKDFFQNNIKKYLFKDKAFNKLLNYGIPNYLRFFIWDIVICERYKNHKYFNYEQELMEYKSILQKNGTNPQIEKDVNRTFMKDIEQTPKNIQMLRNILNCINKYNPSGYCQGMNFIVGYLLKITNFDEVKTFHIFKNILYDIKGYFEVGLPLLKKNNDLFTKNLKELNPKLFKYFQKHDIVNEFWVGKWLQTLFTLTLPFDELNVVWDVLLIRGFDFILYICLAIADFIEKDILEIKESSDIVGFFDKVLNPNESTLIPVNKKFFEDIDNYIIPLSEILARAYDLEKKNVGGNENRPYYDRRKSDSNLVNFKLNNLSNLNKNMDDNNILLKKDSAEASPSSNAPINNLNIGNIQKKNMISASYNSEINSGNKKSAFYSTKNLEIFNFGDLPKDKQRTNIQQNQINFSQKNLLGYNFVPGQMGQPGQINYLNNNMFNVGQNNYMNQYH